MSIERSIEIPEDNSVADFKEYAIDSIESFAPACAPGSCGGGPGGACQGACRGCRIEISDLLKDESK